MTSLNIKLVNAKDTWITSLDYRHHVINGFYAAYNIYNDTSQNDKKNVHMTDVENAFIALLSMLRATAIGISDQNFLTIMSGEPLYAGKWIELYKRLVGIKPIQKAEYGIVNLLKGDENLVRDATGNYKLPNAIISCFKDERSLLQGLNGLAPGTVLPKAHKEDELDDEKILVEWKRINNIRKRKVAGVATKPKTTKRGRKIEKRGGKQQQDDSSDDEDTVSEQGIEVNDNEDTKPPAGIFTEDEEMVAQQLIRGSYHPQFNDNEASL